ncbi:class I adenylate-forming enzyme family protein [Altererythrobacter sp. H2]|uniref:class I adenylate-forming enzyme family protein n=1 Tax=Altererythrobacter sp. H2 TaxID=3108391 RepID=UPI002B4C078E|nr:class I adenylate-forming enzyme family protein [Altererythrobacter sp. H2]WRK95182.1 class I adenylate-forming enzyme family protein [Altererythrobacter sp. H2]
MTQVDPLFAAVTAPGTPFELTERDGLLQFANAAPDLALMIDHARRHGDRTFLVDFSSDGAERRLTFEQVFAWRDQLVPMLQIRRGDRVAICMRNRAEWIVAFMAVVKAGGIAALLNSRGLPAELVAMLDDVTPALVLADSRRAALIREGGYQGRMLDLTKPFDGQEIERRAAQDLPDPGLAQPLDPVTILFTSGTTGRVKGAVLTHRSLITGLMLMQLSGVMVLHNMARAHGIPAETLMANLPQQSALLVYPLFHISGLGAAFLSPLFAGSKVVIMRRWDAQEAVRLIEAEKITLFSAVPTMMWDLLHRAKLGDADLSSLRNVASGGQALPVNLLDEIRAVCPQAVMGTGYGMTEASGSLAQAVGEDFIRNRASAGRVLPLAQVRIVAPDGTVMPTGQSGEIQLRGAMVMAGYWNRPDETAAAFTDDGWLKTGDVGYVDAEGYIFIVDRVKDMVISGGENIYCAEVERVMGEMPGVGECAAFGIPDERLGELLVAVVKGEGPGEQAVIDWVGERLARYKAPGRVAIVKDPLPRNDVGKVNKVALRAAWPNLIGEL